MGRRTGTVQEYSTTRCRVFDPLFSSRSQLRSAHWQCNKVNVRVSSQQTHTDRHVSPLLICMSSSSRSIAVAMKDNITSQRGMLKSIQTRVTTLASILPSRSPITFLPLDLFSWFRMEMSVFRRKLVCLGCTCAQATTACRGSCYDSLQSLTHSEHRGEKI